MKRLLAAMMIAGIAGCASGGVKRTASTQPAMAKATVKAHKIDPRSIATGPSTAVKYATSIISPAVVRLDVVTETFSQGQARSSRAIGSGVIIDAQGHILTNFHVAGRAKRIDVTLSNLEHVRGKLVGSDHWTDLALVQLDLDAMKKRGLSFSYAPMGNSSDVQLGQPVMAVGTPYGLSRTVTAGIVSNTDRFFDETTIEGYETGWFNNWIQTDAAINPGNSGGPLINLRGEVIGINTRGVSEGNNLGFAIPIDTAKEVIGKLLKDGKVVRSYTGITLQPLQDLETFYDIKADEGVLIASVEQDSPASRAGLKAEDILLAVNGIPVNVRFPEQLAYVRKLISDYPVGSTLKFTVLRSGSSATTSATTAATTAPTTAAGRGPEVTVSLTTEKLESVVTEEQSIAAWGLSVRDLTRAYLREQRIPYTQGVLVTGTRPGSPAERAQIQPDDIILRVGNKPVTSTEELQAAVDAWQKSPKTIEVDVRRDRGELIRIIKPESD
ncbi:MAG TPA: trypsin-like peptidase domain-containing protein [Phycisphaerae bacterium]|nr:trypsin-like peptidase domain-containing protein [Phycisphaerae bacterium]